MPAFVPMPGESLWYEHHAPEGEGLTFVFVNALTGSGDQWEERIAPALRAAGHGTLAWDYRGQANSHTAPETELTPDLIVGDLEQLVAEVAPRRPVLVGLSIGGLFAAQAVLAGLEAEGLVLMNTLRKPGLRLDWINEATFRAIANGGPALLQDLLLPMLVGPETLGRLRPGRLGDEPYRPLPPDSGVYRLMRHARRADWDIAYEQLRLPVLVMTGREDRVFRVESDVAELTDRLPDVRKLELDGVGHLIPAEAPDRTIEALLGFADEIA